GDTVPARWGEHRVPRDLAVVVRVHVDEAGREEEPRRVDLLTRFVAYFTDLGDASVVDRHVGAVGLRGGGAVDDRRTANHQVVHDRPPAAPPGPEPGSSVPRRYRGGSGSAGVDPDRPAGGPQRDGAVG